MSFRRILVLLAVLATALFACCRLSEFDVCWHLRAGEWILAHGEVPRVDAFSHTAAGKPWIDFEWLSQAVFYALTAAGGLDALILFKMGVIAAAFLCAAFTARRLGTPAEIVCLLMLLAVLAAHERFFSRPDMFSLLAVAWAVSAHEALSRGRRGPALTLPLVQVLWTNLHGGFILGPLVGVAFLAGGILNSALRSPERDAEVPAVGRGSLAWTAGITLASALACLVNPYGVRLALYPFTEIPLVPGARRRSIFLETIAEWQSPFASMEWGHPMSMAFYAWTALWILVALLRFRRADFRGVCLALGMSVLAASARRHVAVHAVATLPFLARELWGAARVPGRKGAMAALAGAVGYAAWVVWATRGTAHPAVVLATLLAPAGILAWPLLSAAGRALLRARPAVPLRGLMDSVLAALLVSWCLSLASDGFNRAYGGGRVFGFGADASRYPEGAVRYMEAHAIHGRLFNNLGAGGFLAWRAPQVPVFIDGRNLLYGEAFFREYLSALSSEAAWRSLVEAHGITVVLLSQVESLGNLIERLEGSPEWRLVYADHLSRLFIRKVPETRSMLARLPEGVGCLPLGLAPVGPPGRAPSRWADTVRRLLAAPSGWEAQDALARAVLLRIRGDLGGAASFYAAALLRNPDDAQALMELGTLYERLGLLPMAESMFRRLLILRDDRRTRVLLGTVLLKQGKREEALGEYAHADPQDPTPHNNLAVDAMSRGRVEEAIVLFGKAVRLDPADARLLCNLGAALEDALREDEAAAVLRRALDLDPTGSPAGRQLAELTLRRLRRSPGNAGLANNLGTIYHQMGQLGAAEAWYRHALALGADLPGVRANLAVLALERGDADGVEALVREMESRGEKVPERVRSRRAGR